MPKIEIDGVVMEDMEFKHMTDREILLRIKREAEDALHSTKSARTSGDVGRQIELILNSIDTQLALAPVEANASVDVGKLVERFLS